MELSFMDVSRNSERSILYLHTVFHDSQTHVISMRKNHTIYIVPMVSTFMLESPRRCLGIYFKACCFQQGSKVWIWTRIWTPRMLQRRGTGKFAVSATWIQRNMSRTRIRAKVIKQVILPEQPWVEEGVHSPFSKKGSRALHSSSPMDAATVASLSSKSTSISCSMRLLMGPFPEFILSLIQDCKVGLFNRSLK